MFTAFDVGFAVLVLISAILATARGLTREILSLVTWAGSAAIAAYMYFKHPDLAQQYIHETIVANVATVAVSFIVSLVILHLITMRIADFVVDSRVGALDRTLGFIFGVARGVVIAIVVVVFGLWLLSKFVLSPTGPVTEDKKLPDWARQSQSLPYLVTAGVELYHALPPNLEEQFTNLLKRGKENGQAAGTTTEGSEPTDEGSPDETTASPDATAPGTDTTAPPATDSTTTTPNTTPAPATPATKPTTPAASGA